jgi:hypothetical protein
MQPFTLNQAAKACHKSKSALLEAMRSGRLSAARNDKGYWMIEPSELFRVYPVNSSSDITNPVDYQFQEPKPTTIQNHQNTAIINAMMAQIDILKDQVAREQAQADYWRQTATMLLTHQPIIETPPAAAQKDSKLWLKLFGRTPHNNG